MKTAKKQVKICISMLLIVCMLIPTPVSTLATQNRTGNFNKNYSISGNGADDIVRVAAAQLGKTGSQLGYSEQWCADFVSDCAALANQSAAIPANGSCLYLRNNIISAGGTYVTASTAKPGDIVFYGSNGASHVEIVYAASNGRVSTYGGNSGSESSLYNRKVKQHATQTMSIAYIVRPNYSGNASGCNCSTDYAGTYTVNTSTYPLTMRSGHGTGYSQITTIPKGTEVTVTKGNGTWAHVIWNGYSGYCSMEYLKKKETERTVEMHIWMSDTMMGEANSEFNLGTMYYLCYELRYADTKERIGNSKNYTITEQFTLPSGEKTKGCTYNNDNNWYGIRCNEIGEYRGTVTISGDFSHTMEVNFEVKVKDTESPDITNVQIYDVSPFGYTVSCEVTDNVGVDRVQFPTWTIKNDQDDIDMSWVTSTKSSGTKSGNTYTFRVNISDHNNERGAYKTHIYAYDVNGNISSTGISVDVPEPEPETTTQRSTETTTQRSTETTTQRPTETTTQRPTETTTQRPTETTTQRPTETTTQRPTETTTQRPTETTTREEETTTRYEEETTTRNEYTVTFWDDENVIETQKVKKGEDAHAPVLTKKGYTLEWDDDFSNISQDMDIATVWIPNEYKVKFNGAGGKTAIKSMYVTFGEGYGELPMAERKGYLFDGWYTKKNGGDEIDEYTDVETAKTHTLYAHWEKVSVPDIDIESIATQWKTISISVQDSEDIDGFQIVYSRNKKFRSYKKISSDYNQKTISNLKQNTVYYIKVRGYVYDSQDKKVYGSYSKKHKVYIK